MKLSSAVIEEILKLIVQCFSRTRLFFWFLKVENLKSNKSEYYVNPILISVTIFS